MLLSVWSSPPKAGRGCGSRRNHFAGIDDRILRGVTIFLGTAASAVQSLSFVRALPELCWSFFLRRHAKPTLFLWRAVQSFACDFNGRLGDRFEQLLCSIRGKDSGRHHICIICWSLSLLVRWWLVGAAWIVGVDKDSEGRGGSYVPLFMQIS